LQGDRLHKATTWVVHAESAREAILSATEFLVAQRNCSRQKAFEWMQQEAMAKRVTLDAVAAAVITGESVAYRHSVPI
jgi:AmiR/NasT family two-component response regulator